MISEKTNPVRMSQREQVHHKPEHASQPGSAHSGPVRVGQHDLLEEDGTTPQHQQELLELSLGTEPTTHTSDHVTSYRAGTENASAVGGVNKSEVQPLIMVLKPDWSLYTILI